MLPCKDLGRRHDGGLPSGLDDAGRCGKRNHRLSGADVALQQTQHPLRQSEVGGDVFERLLLRMRERVRQRLQYACPQASLAGAAAAGLTAHMCPDKRKRELPGQQFVISKPRPCRMFGEDVRRLARPMKVPQGRIEIRKFLACDPGFVLPLRDCRQAGQRAVHCTANIAQR